jgi:CBS domain containing-hemolysin-like protein
MSTLTLIEILSIVVIIAWNAFFVAAEYAFVSVRRTRLEELVAQGNRRARMVKGIVERPSHFISAMQLAVTLSSLALGAIGEPAVSRLLKDAFGSVSSGVATTISVIVAFGLISALHVVLGEIVPKSYTLANSERVALFVAGPTRLFFFLFGPIISALDWLSQQVLKLVGVDSSGHGQDVHSEEELKMLVRRSSSRGVLEASEQEMLDKVFDFADTEVEDVMIPRPDVVALPVTLTPAEALAEVLEHPYTRYPVFEEDLDDIVGVLHVRTLFGAMQNGGAAEPNLRGLCRPAHVVPETKRLGVLLAEFRRMNSHMAVVVDEYGSVAGIVTLEDLLEEIVGDIADEFDRPDSSVLRLGRNRVRVEGSYPIEEFNERFEHPLPAADYHTVGGFVFGELGRAPVPGDAVTVEGSRFAVVDVDGPRILHVDVTFPGETTAPASSGL